MKYGSRKLYYTILYFGPDDIDFKFLKKYPPIKMERGECLRNILLHLSIWNDLCPNLD